MRRNSTIVSLALILVLSVVLAACGSKDNGSSQQTAAPGASGSSTPAASSTQPADDGKKYKLVMNVPSSATSPEGVNVYSAWAKQVEEKSNGRLTVDLYFSSALGSTAKSLFEIESKVYDVGLIVTNYFVDAGFYPYTATSLPFAVPDVDTSFNVNQKFSKLYMDEEVAFKNVMNLGYQWGSDHYVLFSKKPVEKVEDIKGMNIIVANQAVAELITKWGGTPITMTAADTYQALERGVADGTFMTGVAGMTSFKFYEVAPYYVYLRAWSNPSWMAINRDTYNNLPDDLKKVIDETSDFMPHAYLQSVKNAVVEAEKNAAELAKPIEISDAELARFMEPVKGAWENWAAEATKRGYDGDKMLADFIQILNEEGLKAPWE